MKKIILLISLILLVGCSYKSYTTNCECNQMKKTTLEVGVVCDDSGCLEDEW